MRKGRYSAFAFGEKPENFNTGPPYVRHFLMRGVIKD